MSFAAKLKELRTERGLTQEALAKASGIPVSTIRDYEQGKRDPLFSNAQRLAGALAVSLDVFPAPEPTVNPSPPQRKAAGAAAAKKGRPRNGK